jgi:hypothetical protein
MAASLRPKPIAQPELFRALERVSTSRYKLMQNKDLFILFCLAETRLEEVK